MSKNKIEFEWDSIVNDPAHKAEGDLRALEEESLRAGKQQVIADFRAQCAKRRKTRIETQAYKYTIAALVTFAVAVFVGTGGIGWLGWTLAAVAVCLGLIGSYGFGCAYEAHR